MITITATMATARRRQSNDAKGDGFAQWTMAGSEVWRTNSRSKLENLIHAVSLHYVHYNFGQPHATLMKRRGQLMTRQLAAGIAKYQ